MKRITMFVWNHFTNDARVLREAKTLQRNNYNVKIVAIHNPKTPELPTKELLGPNIHVERVRMYPILWDLFKKNKKIVAAAGGLYVFVGAVITFRRSVMSGIGYLLRMGAILQLLRTRSFQRNALKTVRSLRMIISGFQHKPDIVHSHDLNTLTQGIIVSRLFGRKPLIYDSHEVQTERTGYNEKVAQIWEGTHVPLVDRVIVENKTRGALFEWMYGVRPLPLYNYSKYVDVKKVPHIDVHTRLGLDPEEKILLYQGGLQAGRGLEQLIDAMQYIDEGTLVFIGDGKIRGELEDKVQQLNLATRVKFIGKVPLEELFSYTKEAYLGFQVLQNVNMNHYTASSNKLFEYMMMHVPVVGCDLPEIAQVIEKEEVGLSIDAESPLEIAHAVGRLMNNKKLYEKCVMNCKRAKHFYNWSREEKKLVDLYKGLYE